MELSRPSNPVRKGIDVQKRRFALYFSWSRPAELGAEHGILENRYPTLFEFRRALWPIADGLRDPSRFKQDISGFLDHVILSDFEQFRQLVAEETGHEVPVVQRLDAKTSPSLLDESFLDAVDTLIVISLDHVRTEQTCSPAEVEALRSFLASEGKCVVVCPHHEIGSRETSREEEFSHHGDRLVPSEQQIGGYARSLLRQLGFAVMNQFGLAPGRAADGGPAELLVYRDLDPGGLLEGVRTFNLHPHLPHLSYPADLNERVKVLARQPIDSSAEPHPFFEMGNRAFNALLELTSDYMGGRLLVCDATLWSSAFGGLPSLRQFWRNLAQMPL